MRPTRGPRAAAVLLAAALLCAACAPFPDAPATVGEDFPGGGIPVGVAWPSDWLEGFAGESESAPGPIVGVRLEYVDDTWVWRVRSLDPGRDFDGGVTEPARGKEALVDASSLRLLREHHVQLSDAELAPQEVGPYDAAQLSGETYPSPRLIGLERVEADGRAVWRVTTYDTETGVQSVTTIDAATRDPE